MVIKEFNLKKVNGQFLRGYIYLPDRFRGQIPCVIMSHGFSANMFSDADIVEPLTKVGIGAVIFDYRGGSPISRSDGAFTEMSVMTEVDDLKDILKSVQKMTIFDQIFLLGASQGGLVAAITAAEEKGIDGLILYFPAFVIPNFARRLYQNKESVPERAEVLGLTVGKQYFTDVMDLDAFEYARAYSGPVLILQGTADPLIPLEDTIRLTELYKNSELILYEGQGHGFEGEYRKKCIEDVIRFLKQHTHSI